jgi:His/Glu/Gln/Arg/opine family amino acid ABC transporter permease subunit
MQWHVVTESFGYLLAGARATLLLSATALLTGTGLGIVWGMLRVLPVPTLQRFMVGVIDGVRAVPLLLQMFFIFFGLPAVGVQMPVFVSAALAMTLWMAANLAEVMRGAVESIQRGQFEAGYSSGLGYAQVMRWIILPQALRRMLPPYVGLCTILIKDTSLAAIIGVFELTRAAQETIERTFRSFELYLTIGAMYFVLCFALTLLSRALERRVGEPDRILTH